MRKISLLAVCVLGVVLGALTLRAEAATVVNLRIEGAEATLFAGSVTVEDCVVTDTGGGQHILSGVAACALVKAAGESGFDMDFEDFGFGLFLQRIGGDDTPADFSQSWSFWVNDSPASVGVDAYGVAAGDEILLAFTSWPGIPLRVTGPEEVVGGETASWLVEKRVGEYDNNFAWQGRWEPAEGAVLRVGEASYPVPVGGVVEVALAGPGELVVQAQGEGLVRSARYVVEVRDLAASPSPSLMFSPSPVASPSPVLSPSPSPVPSLNLSGGAASVGTRQSSAERALDWLRGQQSSDGNIGGDMTSAWSAMAFGADYQWASDVVRGGDSLLAALGRASLNRATDIERQILAIRAAGADPGSFNGRDLVSDLKGDFKQGQFGEEALINDDIFGILALLAAAEEASTTEIVQAVAGVLKAQESDGSWGSVDMTAAAVQALQAYAREGGSVVVSEAVDRARGYLRDNQDQYGGWGENSATTAWAIQAIVALGESPGDWQTGSGQTPWQALLRYRNSNGGFGWKSDNDVSSFMTAYAVPALLGVPWPITLLDIKTMTVETSEPLAGELVVVSSPAVSPAVAGATIEQLPAYASDVTGAEQALGVQPDGTGAEGAVTPTGFISPGAGDRVFVVALFSLANLGIGVVLARLMLL